VAAYYSLQAAYSSAAQEDGMPAVRTEVKHPQLVREALDAAYRHAVQVYGVSESSVRRALARHYTEELQAQVVAHAAENLRLRGALGEAEQHLAWTQTELQAVLGWTQAELAAARRVSTEADSERRSLASELEDLRDVARVGYEPPPGDEVAELREQLALATVALNLRDEQLYAVQQVTTLEQAANALEDGRVLGTLGQQLVLVRPVHVYDGTGVVLHHAEVVHGGAAVCTAAGLAQAGLPVPGAGG
jgi:hypothetical protein